MGGPFCLYGLLVIEEESKLHLSVDFSWCLGVIILSCKDYRRQLPASGLINRSRKQPKNAPPNTERVAARSSPKR